MPVINIPFWKKSDVQGAVNLRMNKKTCLSGQYTESKYDQTKFKEVINNNTETSLFDQSSQIDLLTGLFECWRYDKGVAISPEMIYCQVCAEIGREIRDYPDVYRDLFTDSTEKKELNVQGMMNEWPRLLLHELIDNVVSKDLKKFFQNMKLSNMSEEACEFLIYSQLEGAEAYYNFYGTKCGIPHIEITGSMSDWSEIRNKFQQMKKIFNHHKEFLDRAAKTIDEILVYTFEHMYFQEVRAQVFFKNMFVLNGHRGRSGDDEYEITGWITNFYVKNSAQLRQGSRAIHRYRCEVACVPIVDLEIGKYFFFISGLCGSTYNQETNTVYMKYQKYLLETDEDTYKKRKNG